MNQLRMVGFAHNQVSDYLDPWHVENGSGSSWWVLLRFERSKCRVDASSGDGVNDVNPQDFGSPMIIVGGYSYCYSSYVGLIMIVGLLCQTNHHNGFSKLCWWLLCDVNRDRDRPSLALLTNAWGCPQTVGPTNHPIIAIVNRETNHSWGYNIFGQSHLRATVNNSEATGRTTSATMNYEVVPTRYQRC